VTGKRALDNQPLAVRSFTLTLTTMLAMLVVGCLVEWGAFSSHHSTRHGAKGYAAIWPQGWSFFTGLDKNQMIDAYTIAPNGTLGAAENQRSGWSDQDWGLNRTRDSVSAQFVRLAQQIPQQYWQQCGDAVPSSCHVRLAASDEFAVRGGSVPGLCGLDAVSVDLPGTSKTGYLPTSPRTVYRVAVVNLACPR
jgi:hypothetical protein